MAPSAKPDIKDAPWDDVNGIYGFFWGWVSFNAWLIQEPMYFWSQLFTWGKSNLRDFQLIYMTNTEAALYIWAEVLILPFNIPFAILWCIWCWWIYLIWIVYEVFIAEEEYNAEENLEDDLHLRRRKTK